MKRCIFFLFVIASNYSFGQIWSETFDEAAGATSGTGTPSGAWTSTCAGCSARDGFGNLFEVSVTGGGYFSAGRSNGGMGNEGVWTSPVISISGFTDIKVYLETGALLTEAGDYMRVYYRLNTGAGLGAEILFHTATNGSVTSIGISPALTGTQVQIVMRSFTDAALDFFTFDNISVTNTLFSRATAVWGTSGTWSAVAIGGADCTCTPTQFTDVVVGGTHTVTIGGAAAVASLLVNGTADVGGAGTLTFSGNFALDISRAGPVTVNSGGQITSGGNLSAALTFTDNQSHTVTNNGTISIGDLTVTNSSLFTPTVITMTGASAFTVTDALSLSESSAQSVTLTNGVPMTIGGAATINNTSTFANNSVVTMSSTAVAVLNGAGTWTQGVNSTLNYAGSTLTVATFDALNPGNTVDYNRAGIQTIATTTYYNLTLSNTSAKSAAGSFAVRGNWTRSGTATFTPGANTVTFSALAGSAAQTISAVGGETFFGLTINSAFATSPQIITNNAVTVTGTLTMTSGIVNLAGTTFTLGSSGVASTLSRTASTTTNWMYGGSFRRFWLNATAVSSTAGNLYGLFPVGASTASSYRPVVVNSTANPTATGSYTVTHIDASGVTDLSPVFDDDPAAGVTNIVRKHNAQFVNAISGVTGGTYNVGVTMTGLLAGTLGDIRLAKSNGATTVNNAGTHAAATGTAPNPTANRTAVTLAGLSGDFRITTINLTNTPLPVELIDFKANLKSEKVELDWSTASELNNDFFTIERTSDLEKFEEVTTMKGQGTINSKTNYSAVDESPLPGVSYYRLKQTDFDGKFTYSELRKVEASEIKTNFRVYPNPVINNKLSIELAGMTPRVETPVRIVNMQGVSVFESNYLSDQYGRIKATVELNLVSSGMYIVIINSATGLRKKIVIP